VAVQDAEAPRGQDQQPDPRGQDADEADGQVAALAGEAGGQQGRQRVGQQDRDEGDRTGQHGDQAEHRARDLARILLAVLLQQAGVDRDERRGQHAFAQQVLHEVGDAIRGRERVGHARQAEEVGEGALANESAEPRGQDPRGNQRRVAPAHRHRRGRSRSVVTPNSSQIASNSARGTPVCSRWSRSWGSGTSVASVANSR
jgi:hypothetical protein